MSVPCFEGKVLVDIREFFAGREGGVKAERKKVQLPSLDGGWGCGSHPTLCGGRPGHATLRDSLEGSVLSQLGWQQLKKSTKGECKPPVRPGAWQDSSEQCRKLLCRIL